jgi:peptide/nickel transport system ATP-binding protein
MTPVLEIQNLNVNYHSSRGVARAVRDLSLTINGGETYGLVGESGCGKSTVALTIMRYLPHQAKASGEIRFQGHDLMQAPAEELRHLRGNRISMVYQDPQASLNPVLTIERQLSEVIAAHEEISPSESRRRILDILEKVRMPDPQYILGRYPHQLSGGMQQRVVIAMALLLRPDLVVMDEPTTGLDVTIEAGVLDILDDLRREFKMAILYISHNLGVITRICDRVGVMYAGELIEQAPVKDLFAHPSHPYTLGLLRCVPRQGLRYTNEALYSIPGRVPPLTALPQGCAFAPRCALAESACTAAHPRLESTAQDHVARCIHWKTVVEQPERVTFTKPVSTQADQDAKKELLNVRGLKVYFMQALDVLGIRKRPNIKVIDGVDFDLPAQRTLGVVGESGCGKSTIAKVLAGLTPATSGEIEFSGSDFARPIKARSSDSLQQLQMVFQNPDSSLNPRHTIAQTLSRPLRRFRIVPPEQEKETIISLLRSVNLDESYLDRYPSQLSGGEKQRVAIARAFAGNPELVVCDEPISSLDVSVQAAILNLLHELQHQQEVALVFIAHDLNVVRYISDEVAVIYLGRICEIGPTDRIFSAPSHPYTEALMSAIPVADPNAHINPIRLSGTVPSPANPPTGCRFHTRCPRKIGDICETHEPRAQDASDGHKIFCHIPLDELRILQSDSLVKI